MAPQRVTYLTQNQNNNNKQKSPAIPRSESMHLLAHLSNHLLPDNELSNHRHTHTHKKGELCTIYKQNTWNKYATHPKIT